MVLLIYDEFVLRNSPSSLAHQSSPGQSVRSQIDSRHFGVNRPIDPNALPFCENDERRMFMSVVYPCLLFFFIMFIALLANNYLVPCSSSFHVFYFYTLIYLRMNLAYVCPLVAALTFVGTVIFPYEFNLFEANFSLRFSYIWLAFSLCNI